MQRTKPVPLPSAATMDDVARHAGVSQSTVSRVLNGTGGVSQIKVERVLAACAALRFHPNTTARVLAGGRSRAIGLWTPDIRNPFFVQIVSGVLEAAQERGYVITLSSYAGERPSRRYAKTAESLAAFPVGGVILIGSRDRDPALDLFRRRGVPIVTVDHRSFDESSDVVNIDNIAASHAAVTHLIANGYRRIGIIAGSSRSMTSRDRLAGYKLALQDAGLDLDEHLEFHGLYDEKTGYQGTNSLLNLPQPVDALFTTCNEHTVGVLHALYDRGLRVPDDLGLVGFDELPMEIPGAPLLTCVVQPAFALGNTAARLLMDRLEHAEQHVRQEVILRYHLRIGGTTQLMPAADSGAAPTRANPAP